MPQPYALVLIGVKSVALWPLIWLSLWYLVRARGAEPNLLARWFLVAALVLGLAGELIPASAHQIFRVVSHFTYFLHFWLCVFTAYILQGQGNGWWPLPGNSNSNQKDEETGELGP